jgi:TRAP-type C4-dicarboxylate transport system substrate-binding protein
MSLKALTRNIGHAVRSSIVVAGLCASSFAMSQVKWDLPIAWTVSNYHTQNAMAFANAVKERTQGRVVITVHPGGALGLKGPETLRAVRDGIVPIAEMFLSQQSGDLPFLSIESMPFLVRSPEELATLYKITMPRMERLLAGFNQKLIYIVPWPSQMIYTRNAPVLRQDDLKGLKIRTTDRNNADMMTALGMSPVALPVSDLVPALAAGTVQAIQTSAPLIMDLKLWEFVKFGLYTNHSWSSNMVTVNLDKWKQLSAADQKAIEDLGREMQPKFWQISINTDKEAQKVLAERGVKISPLSADALAQMEKTTRPLWNTFMDRVPAAREPMNEYLKAVGRN